VTARRALAADAALVVLALASVYAPLRPAWVENGYANGLFARLNETFVPLSNALPFAAGDLFVAAALALLAALWIRRRSILHAAAHTLGFAALLTFAFELLWGWNYHRAPVIARVAYDSARVTPPAVHALAERIVATLNDNVTAAHARAAAATPAELDAELRRDFLPVAVRLGDRRPVALTVPKHSIANLLYEMAGVGGQYDPFAFETLLNASFLPYEIPRALAHEWAHVAGFGDEGDANFIGTVTCLRSADPLIRYSGAFWTYAELPEAERSRLHVSPAVAADFAAARARFLRHYQPQLFDLSWLVYDRYLRANGVAGGVTSYSRFVALLAGTPFDRDGLPEAIANP
jgi:hypothetical protein